MHRGERIVLRRARPGQQGMVRGPVRGEGRLRFAYMVEERDGVLDRRDSRVGLKEGVEVDPSLSSSGDYGIEELFGVGEIWGREGGLERA